MMVNFSSGNSAATFCSASPGEKPTAMIGDWAVAGEAAQRLLALRVVGGLEVAKLDAGLGLELLGAVEGGLVEGFVELAAQVVDDRRLDVGGECRKAHRGSGQKAKNDTFHVIHTLSVVFFASCRAFPGSARRCTAMAGASTLRS